MEKRIKILPLARLERNTGCIGATLGATLGLDCGVIEKGEKKANFPGFCR